MIKAAEYSVRTMRLAQNAGAFLVFLLLWQVAALFLPPTVLPSVIDIARALGDLLNSRSNLYPLIDQFSISFYRIYSGLLIAALIGILLGFAMGRSEFAEDVFSPALSAIYPIPKPALVPLLAMWIGLGSKVIIVCAVLSAMLPFVVNTFNGVRSVSQKLIWSALSLGAGWRAVEIKVILPAILPNLLVGLRIAHNMAVTTVVAAEFVVAQKGIGALISDFGNAGAYDFMFATTFIVIVIVAAFDQAVQSISNRALRRYHHGSPGR